MNNPVSTRPAWFILIVAMMVFVPVSTGLPSGDSDTDSCLPYRMPVLPRSCWSLHLDDLELRSDRITMIRGRFVNLSDRTISIDAGVLGSQVATGARVWQKGRDGCGRIRTRKGIHISPMEQFVSLHAGESYVFLWQDNEVHSESLSHAYEFTMTSTHSGDIRSTPTVTLEPGEYLIDATIDIDIFTQESPATMTRLGFVTVCSANKLWRTVDVRGSRAGSQERVRNVERGELTRERVQKELRR